MDYKFVIKDGHLVEKEKACVSVFNKALFFDFTVYSNIKVATDKLFLPPIKIEKYDEHFISNTSMNIMPVRQMNNIILNKTLAGKLKNQ
jgi:branched-subunit amino acid aminotransferase/4-amino-4-deoxychorismate lyase